MSGAASASPCHVACATQTNSRPQGACSAVAAGGTGKRGLRVALVARGGRVPAPEFKAHIACGVTLICTCHVACVVRRVRCVGKKQTIRRLLGCSGENHSKEWLRVARVNRPASRGRIPVPAHARDRISVSVHARTRDGGAESEGGRPRLVARSAVTVGAWAARRLTAPSIAALGPKLVSVNPMFAHCYVNGAHRGEVEELVVQIRRFGIVLTALISRAVRCTRRVETRRVPVGGSVAMMVSTPPIVRFWRGKMAHTESRMLRFRGGTSGRKMAHTESRMLRFRD